MKLAGREDVFLVLEEWEATRGQVGQALRARRIRAHAPPMTSSLSFISLGAVTLNLNFVKELDRDC